LIGLRYTGKELSAIIRWSWRGDSCAFENEIPPNFKSSEHCPCFTWSSCKLHCWST